MSDPFESADGEAAGFLGQSPEFWRHLAEFGAKLVEKRNAKPAGPDWLAITREFG